MSYDDPETWKKGQIKTTVLLYDWLYWYIVGGLPQATTFTVQDCNVMKGEWGISQQIM